MSNYKKRLKEFEATIFESEEINFDHLRKLCFNGIPDSNGLRALCWKMLLGYLSTNRSEWEETLSQKRNLYNQFVNEMVVPPGHDIQNKCIDHPLSEGPDSKWGTFFRDNEFLLQIDKDVRRLYPDISFFQQPTDFPCDLIVNSNGERRLHQWVVPSMFSSANVERKGLGMTKINLITKRSIENYKAMDEGQEAHWEVVQRILFIYAKLNPGQGYVQGMNEIIGPIYYIMASDQHTDDRRYAEADTFFCFTALMSEIRDFFIKTLDDSEGGIKKMMCKLTNMVKEKAPEIHDKLKEQELHPQFYSFRWLTLLLSQEFFLPEVVRIWDSLFADRCRFSFLINVCCSMIMKVGDQILANDFASNVKLLQNYPPIDVNLILSKAVEL